MDFFSTNHIRHGIGLDAYYDCSLQQPCKGGISLGRGVTCPRSESSPWDSKPRLFLGHHQPPLHTVFLYCWIHLRRSLPSTHPLSFSGRAIEILSTQTATTNRWIALLSYAMPSAHFKYLGKMFALDLLSYEMSWLDTRNEVGKEGKFWYFSRAVRTWISGSDWTTQKI